MKHGSVFDLFSSINFNNIRAMIKVGLDNQDLLRYLISEVLQTRQSRIKSLREYYPEVDINDWFLAGAGQRVQIIKKCPDNVGKLEFGTEVVTAADHSLATLLGASPGASVSVDAMMQVIEKCFAVQLATEQWQQKIKQMIPSYGESLINNKELSEKIHEYTLSTLKLNAL
jgi:malate dehydrogenase (quinone)